MQHPRFSLVIPAFEEAALITQTLGQVHHCLSATQLLDQTEVVVVVAEGRDNTRGLVEAQENRFPFFQLVLPGEKVGKGRDVTAGVLAARGEFILFTDADLATPLRHIQPAFALLESGQVDMLIGTRDLWEVHKTWGRRLLSGGANLFIRWAVLPGIQDSQCGFKGFTRQAAHQLFAPLTTVGWGFDLELLVLARENHLRLRTVEIPDWDDPKLSAGLAGEPIWKAGLATLQELWRIRQQHPLVGRPLVRFLLASLLSGLVFLGLQLISLNRWSFWHDESFTALLIQYDWGELLKRVAYDVHPPLYYLVLKLWASIFGSSVLALRSFSVVCMLVVFGLSVWLVKRLAGLMAAWWALPFLALAPALVRYGQEARMYGMAAIFGLCATHVLLSILPGVSNRKTARWWALLGAYVLCLVGLVYTHYFAFLIVLAHWAAFWVSLRQTKPGLRWFSAACRRLVTQGWWWLAAYAMVLLAFWPWASSFQQQLGMTVHNFWVEDVSVHSLFSTLATFLVFRPEWLSWHLTGWYAVVVLAGITLLGWLIALTFKTRRLSSVAKIILIGYWSLPMLALFLLSLPPLTPYYYDRYFVTFSPVFYALLGVGSWVVVSGTEQFRLSRLLVPLGLCGALLYGTWNVQVYGNNFGHAEQDTFSMRELSADIRGLWQPGDVVVCLSREQFFDAKYYLGDLTQVRYFTLRPFDQFGDTSVVFDREDILLTTLSDLFLPSGRVWIISDQDEGLTTSLPSSWIGHQGPVVRGYAQATLYTSK